MPQVPVVVRERRYGTIASIIAREPMRCLVDDRGADAGRPCALTAPVTTVSFSGNAFSVIERRAAGSSRPAATPCSVQKLRRWLDDLADLLLRQQVLERRHDRGEAARRSAVGDDGAPLDVRLRRGRGAVAEIREGRRQFEAAQVLGLPLPVGTVAGDAARFLDFFAGVERFRLDRRRDARRSAQTQGQPERHSGLRNMASCRSRSSGERLMVL